MAVGYWKDLKIKVVSFGNIVQKVAKRIRKSQGRNMEKKVYKFEKKNAKISKLIEGVTEIKELCFGRDLSPEGTITDSIPSKTECPAHNSSLLQVTMYFRTFDHLSSKIHPHERILTKSHRVFLQTRMRKSRENQRMSSTIKKHCWAENRQCEWLFKT